MTKPTVFISYSHKDEEWKDRLVTHLGVLQSQGLLDLWDDRRIGAGEDWKQEIQEAMDAASVAVLLVSAHFLTSQFILGEEVPRLLERRDKEGLRIFPVIVKPCVWQTVGWLSRMQARPKGGRPLSAGDEHQIDADLAAIAEEVAAIIGRLAGMTTPEGPASIDPETSTSVHGRDQMSKLPQTLLDFASTSSLQDWENHDFLTLEPNIKFKQVLVKEGREFDPEVSSPPLGWQSLHYHELVVRLHPESFIYINVSDEMGENRTLLYSSAILFGMNQWKQFHVPLGKDVSDGKWHSLIIGIPKHMEQAQWPGFVKVDCLRLRGEVALAVIRGCDDKNSLIEPATDSPYVVPLPVLRMSKLPQILLDFASNPSLQGWENNDFLKLEYDDTLCKRVLVKKGHGFDPAVSYPPRDWQPLQYYELTVRLHPESVICINVSDERGKDRTLLYSATRPSELNQWKEFYVPLDEDVSNGTWRSLMIDLSKHMEQAHWHGFAKVNRLSLRGEVALAGIRGCDEEDSLRESAIVSLYPVFVPPSKDPARFVPYVISNNCIDLVDADDLLEVARSPRHGRELILWLSVETPDKASAMIEQVGSKLLVSLSKSPQDVRILFSTLEDQSPSVGKLLASMITSEFDTKMAESPEDWRETQLIHQRLQALEKVYDFFEHFVEPEESKPHEDICIFANLISGGVSKSGIFQHPPERGPSILRYSSIPVSDYVKLWLDFYFGILDERPNTGKKQPKFDKPCEGDVVEFGVRINGKRVKLPNSMLNVVGWVHHSLSIEPADGELTVEFIAHARGNAVANWAAWGEPRLLGIRAVPEASREDSATTPNLLGTGNRWAVLVGVNEYEDKANYGQLHVCVKDVGAIYERLIAGGLDPTRIRLLTDDKPELPTRDNILVALKSIAEATEPDDLLLFYYSGHGDEDGGESYLVASNGRRLVLRDTAVPISRVKEIMEQALAHAKVIILDACHSGADIGGKGPKLMSAEFIRRVFQQAEGLAILSSCKQGQLSYEWRENERSVFTYFLLEAFTGQADRDEKGFVTVQDANRHVTNGVKLWASQRNLSQTPTLQYTVVGDIILTQNLHFVPQNAPAIRPRTVVLVPLPASAWNQFQQLAQSQGKTPESYLESLIERTCEQTVPGTDMRVRAIIKDWPVQQLEVDSALFERLRSLGGAAPEQWVSQLIQDALPEEGV